MAGGNQFSGRSNVASLDGSYSLRRVAPTPITSRVEVAYMRFELDTNGDGAPPDWLIREKIMNRMIGLGNKDVTVLVQPAGDPPEDVPDVRFDLDDQGNGVPNSARLQAGLLDPIRTRFPSRTVTISMRVDDGLTVDRP